MHNLIDVLLVIMIAFFVVRQKARRQTVTPGPEPEIRRDLPSRPSPPATHRGPPRAARATTVPVQRRDPAPARGHSYLLGGRRGGGRMAATMEVMAGPGICTPRTPKSSRNPIID